MVARMNKSTPQLFFGKVMHSRLCPKRNSFTYSIYYLAFSLSKIKDLPIARNCFAPLSFHDRDHGHCDGSDLQDWAQNILADYNIKNPGGDIKLICMPRVLGYVFNPVSFWSCHDKEGHLRAVLCEVHNTFGERHTYLCAHEDHRPITADDILRGQKLFHVSPLLKREGHYTYRFDLSNDKFAVRIDYYNSEGQKQLATSLKGRFHPMNKATLRKALWTYPLVTFKAITLIHWQALKLLVKGVKFIPKPAQKPERISTTDNLTKM
jgi:DUF1365 family protein